MIKIKKKNYMKAVILAAGKGSRLYPVTHHVPKPLLPIAGKPTLEHALDQMKQMNIEEVCIVRGQDHDEMESFIGYGDKYNLKISYAVQREQKGLAHALLSAKEFCGEDKFVLYLGDAIYNTSLQKYAQEFLKGNFDNLNLVKPVDNPEQYGVAILEGNKIVQLEEKPKEPKSNMAMAGIYWFSSKIWDAIHAIEPSARGEYEITDAIQYLIDSNHDVRAGIYENTWFDTGTLPSLLEANSHLLNGRNIVGKGSSVHAELGENVYIGNNVQISCKYISNAIILDSSHIDVNGDIIDSALGGDITSPKSISGELLYNAAVLKEKSAARS